MTRPDAGGNIASNTLTCFSARLGLLPRVGNVLGFEQSDDGSRHGKFLSNVFEPERPGTDGHPSRTCSQTCCIANRSKETSGRHGKNADKEAILIICRPWKGKISYMEPSSYPNLAQHLLLKLVSGIQRLYAS